MPSSLSEAQVGVQERPDVPHTPHHDHAMTDDDDDNDIYRGDPPLARSSSPTSIPSSSESSFVGGRLGAIAAVVELAISRWARAQSTSSSGSSSASSIVTTSRSHIARRRKRRPSLENLHSLQSERDITARIKAREESRQRPREFSLYLPPFLGHGNKAVKVVEGDSQVPGHQQRITCTTSLPLILDQLDNAMRKSIKARHHQIRLQTYKVSDHHSLPSLPHHHYMQPDDVHIRTLAADTALLAGPQKGKQKLTTSAMNQPHKPNEVHETQGSWWLDVSSPNWEDMRAIGKVNSLARRIWHLTLTIVTAATFAPLNARGHTTPGSSGEVRTFLKARLLLHRISSDWKSEFVPTENDGGVRWKYPQ